jgi:replicative DNA helicase
MNRTTNTTELLDAAPPSNLEAERGVIVSIMLAPRVADDVALLVGPEDFYNDANSTIVRHLLAMHNDGRKIDVTLLANRLRKAEDFERTGGAAYLAEIMQSGVTPANASHYASIVRDTAIQRELIQSGTQIIRTAHDESEASVAMDECERLILGIRDKRGTLSSNSQPVMSIVQELMAEIENRSAEQPAHISGGFRDLDRLMPLRKNQLIILAARPSMGKTALAMNIAANAAADGNPVLFFSFEMSSMELAERVLAGWAEVDGVRIAQNTMSQDERLRLVTASAEFSQCPLYVDDAPNQNMQKIAATCRRQKRRHGLSLVVIDYLQLIEPDNTREPRQEQVAKISRRLKGLARELEVPVLCLAQLNREADKRTDNRPRLSDLRESGAIEQDADVVAFVHRPEYYNPDDTELHGKAVVIVAKRRNGPIGDANLRWEKKYTSFRDPEVYDAPNYQSSFDSWNEEP